MSFVGELSRRNVIRVGIAYALIAWLIIQVADIVLETIGAPGWVMQTLMLVLLLGFLVTAIFAWAYEVTPDGIKRESEVDRSTSITRLTGRKLDRVIIALLVAALAYFIWESRIAERPVETEPTVETAAVAPDGEVLYTPPAELSIAVLPFDNRSNNPEDEFFTEGMHDDLLTTLAKIGSMKVISRTSVMEYRSTTKKIPEIARELGVENILEGGVQRSGNKVRINVQLIDADTDEHLWAEIYDRELTAENLFAIQSEISKAIADALHATLSPDEVDRIDKVPTQSLDALDHYLLGRKLMATRAVDDLERATQEFLTAVKIDPGFALAWVGVADSHNLLSDYKNLPQGVFDDIRDEAINKALALDPELAEAYASLGTLLDERGKFAEAEDAYRTAIRYSPNYATAWHWLGNSMRQHLLRAPEALRYSLRAVELDPNSAVILANAAGAYSAVGDYDAMARYNQRLLEAHPDFFMARTGMSYAKLRRGDWAEAANDLLAAIGMDRASPQIRLFLATDYVVMGARDEAERVTQRMAEDFPDHPLTELTRLFVAAAFSKPANARAALVNILEDRPDLATAWNSAFAALYVGEFDLALDAFALAKVQVPPDGVYTDDFMSWTAGGHCEIAWTLLETPGNEALGRKLLARAIELYEAGYTDGIRHPERFNPDLCYVLAGEPARALDVIEKQLESGWVDNWRWTLASSPYDAIRDEPRFVAAWAEYERRMAEQLAILRNGRKKPAFEF